MLPGAEECGAQPVGLKDAIEKGSIQYGTVKAKNNYASAAEEAVKAVQRQYLPVLNFSGQQSYGTINGQNGPLSGFGGLGTASSGMPQEAQNWQAAFGGLYLANMNWEFFNFGRTGRQIQLARTEAMQAHKDYEQELFRHQVKIAATYLNLLAAQRLLYTQERNLERVEVFSRQIAGRARNGLLPGVDTAAAAAEVAKARITLNQVKDREQQYNRELLSLLGDASGQILADTSFVAVLPGLLEIPGKNTVTGRHPVLQFFNSRISQSQAKEQLLRRERMPSLYLFGIYQARASGFYYNYGADLQAYTPGYWQGITPTRQNYLVGVSAVWNITGISIAAKRQAAQRAVTQGLQEEFRALETELYNQAEGAYKSYGYALQNHEEAPRQVQAARQAYEQRLALYNNGLNDLTDVTNARYLLNSAEMDRDVAYTNVWQALLMIAASRGDLDLFINEL